MRINGDIDERMVFIQEFAEILALPAPKKTMGSSDQINALNEQAKEMTAQQVIKLAHKEFGSRLVFASSLGEEDQVITDIISKTAAEDYLEISGLDYVTFRLANVIGPRNVSGPLPIFFQRSAPSLYFDFRTSPAS